MLVSDALWLSESLARFSAEEISPLVNLGSSTRQFREEHQPHVQQLIFGPLEARGVHVIHCDLKAADGVDLAGDIYDDQVLAKLRTARPKALLCTHMFEHVLDRDALARRIMAILPMGGLFFVTVPKSYFHHADPLDTMFRPTPEQLAALFPGQEIIEGKILVGGSYRDRFRERPVTLFFRHFVRFMFPTFWTAGWKRSMRKLFWLVHPYEVSAVVGRKLVEYPTF
jgi:hypothetical protein